MTEEFGSALREYRRAAGLSQRELAQKAGLDFSYISKIENGRIPPPAADTIVVICNYLGVKPEELLALTGKIPSEIQANVSSSKEAQVFLREAQLMKLSDEEWSTVTKSLKSLRGEK
jgi:transcriptional regulator with XRE-family HTH domain